MKILIACNKNSYKNPYVQTLANSLSKIGCNVVCSLAEFWNPSSKYSIVHIQWPDLLIKTPWDDCEKIEKQLNYFKKGGSQLFVTCHNLIPHYSHNSAVLKSYKIVYENADCIIHLGEKSIELLKDQLPNIKAKHIVIPHHSYDSIYNIQIDKKKSRKILKIPPNAKCILSFGTFRDDEERNMILSLSKDKNQNYYFLMPGFFRDAIIRKNILLGIKNFFRFFKYSFIAWKNNIAMSHRYISEEMVPIYMSAADVLLIQRKKILNSGNVSLGMFFGLPIVGPNKGNVGSILEKTGNYIFDVDNITTLRSAIAKAVSDKNIGNFNRLYATTYLKTDDIAKKLYEVYKQFCIG